MFALRALLNSLAPLIGAEWELDGKAVASGWAENIPAERMDAWTKRGKELQPELEEVFRKAYDEEYLHLMRKVSLRNVGAVNALTDLFISDWAYAGKTLLMRVR